MLCDLDLDLDLDHRNLNDFPAPVRPSPNQVGPTIWTGLQGMLHPLSWSHPLPGETMGAPFSCRLSWR